MQEPDNAKDSEEGSGMWNRGSATVRLTKVRKDCLMSVAQVLPKSSPVDAIDYCIAVAMADRRVAESMGDQLDRLATLVEHLSTATKQGFADTAESTRKLQGDISHVVDLMSAMAGAQNGYQSSEGDDQAISITEWLDGQAAEFGATTILAKAKWQSSEREAARQANMIMLVERIAAAGTKASIKASLPMMVRLGNLDVEQPLFRAMACENFYLACQRSELKGWTLSANVINPDNSIGPAISSLKA
jgi:hypothetical protein